MTYEEMRLVHLLNKTEHAYRVMRSMTQDLIDEQYLKPDMEDFNAFIVVTGTLLMFFKTFEDSYKAYKRARQDLKEASSEASEEGGSEIPF